MQTFYHLVNFMIDLLELNSPRLTDLLSDELADKLKQISKTIRYSDGQIIHSRGDPKQGISIVRSGAVRIGNFGIDGSFITTSIMGPGQSFGEFTLFAGLPRTHDAIAMDECEVDQIPGRPFKRLFDSEPDLAKALLTMYLVRTHGLLEFTDDMRRLPLLVRVAKLIYSMTRSTQDSGMLRIRQDELAFTFGVSRVSMGKVLKQLESAGLIALGYGKLRIPDLEVLAAWVDERSLITPLIATPEYPK
ncbi:MAG: Crp/Fnr family transcriptional regulator [Pseudomonadota bacterium]